MDYFMGLLGLFLVHVNTTTIGYFLSLVVAISIAVGIYKVHSNKNNPIDLADLFKDRRTGTVNGSKFRLNLAFLVTSWALVYSVLTSNAVEVVLTAYMAAWITDRYNSRKASTEPKIEPPEEPK